MCGADQPAHPSYPRDEARADAPGNVVQQMVVRSGFGVKPHAECGIHAAPSHLRPALWEQFDQIAQQLPPDARGPLPSVWWAFD